MKFPVFRSKYFVGSVINHLSNFVNYALSYRFLWNLALIHLQVLRRFGHNDLFNCVNYGEFGWFSLAIAPIYSVSSTDSVNSARVFLFAETL